MVATSQGAAGLKQSDIISDATPFAGANADVKLSSMQRTLLAAISATVQKLTLEQKAAMDATTYSSIETSGDNYIITSSQALDTADLTTFTLVSPSHITVNSAIKATCNALSETDTTTLYKSKSISGYFKLNFEAGMSAVGSGLWVACGLSDSTTRPIAAVNSIYVIGAGGTGLILGNNTASTPTNSATIAVSESTLYYCTLERNGTTATLSVFSDSGRTTHVAGSPKTLTCNTVALTHFHALSGYNSGGSSNSAAYIQNPSFPALSNVTGNIKSNAITKDANIGLRYWGDIIANLVAGAAGSTIALKICNSAGTPLHTNFVTIASSEYARIPLERPVVLTATGAGQTVWNFTSLSNADAFINELGVLSKAILVELALDGTNYTVLKEVTDFNEDISNPLAPKITLVSGTGIISGTSKLRATYIVNIPLSNTIIKLQIQLNKLVGGDTSPSIRPLVGDATKYVSAGQVAIV